MKKILNILIIATVVTAAVSCSGNNTQVNEGDIVIVGGDTLGRNWDNLPTKEEAEQAAALGLTPEQYLQLKNEQMNQQLATMQEENAGDYQGGDDYVSDVQTTDSVFIHTDFSDQMYKEETYSIESTDGREVIVGSQGKY